MLKTADVITSIRTCLDQLQDVICEHGILGSRKNPSSGIVGSVLAAFIVANHPNVVFESRGSQEETLLLSAQRFLKIFNDICSAFTAQTLDSQTVDSCYAISRELLTSYAEELANYSSLFVKWKDEDKLRLCERIHHSLHAVLDAISQLPSKSESSVQRAQLFSQAKILRDRLGRIGGTAARASFDAKHPTLVAEIETAGESDVTASFLEPMSNEQLAHEVLLDPSYRLPAEVEPVDVPSHGVKSVLQKAFWSGVEEDLRRTPPCYGRVLRVLVQVRDGLAAVAGQSEKVALAELVDEDLMRQQVEKGLYGWKECVVLLSNITSNICTTQVPKRRAETEAMWTALKGEMDSVGLADQPKLLCKGLQFLLARTNVTRADVGNERLLKLAPAIQLHGVDYERDKFKAKLDSNALKLNVTRVWLRKALETQEDKLQKVVENCATAHRYVLAAATAELAAKYNELGVRPETLLLDNTRLKSLSADFHKVVRVATAVLAARCCLAESACPVRIIDEAAAAATASLLKLDAAPDSDLAEAAAAAATSVAGLGCQAPVTKAVQESLAAPSAGLEALLKKRVLEAWTVAAAGGEEASLAGGSLGSGLEALWPAVLRSARILRRMASVNLQVHAERYSSILREEAAALLAGKRV